MDQIAKVLREATGLLGRPQRILPLIQKLAADNLRIAFEQRNLYTYASAKRSSQDSLRSSIHWILDAQSSDGGIAAYYSLLTGYSQSYPEVTGYIIPTLYDFANLDFVGPASAHAAFARVAGDGRAISAAEHATDWLLSLQMPNGAFPAGLYEKDLHGKDLSPSAFNTGQILQGLVRAHRETDRPEILCSALAAGDWLIKMQQPDGSWSGPSAYQNTAHTYYSMVAWALAELSERTGERRYTLAAEKNLNWVLSLFNPSGWIEGINLQGHPIYLHFIAYVLQGVLECASLRRRSDAIDAVSKSAWILLRKFEAHKFLAGAYDADFTHGRRFACLTGNAQMSCIWLRLYELTGDVRYLNAALKMNEMLKQTIPSGATPGIAGGVSGSYPIWGRYQPLRYISWGCKFFADALLLEMRLTRSLAQLATEALPCAS